MRWDLFQLTFISIFSFFRHHLNNDLCQLIITGKAEIGLNVEIRQTEMSLSAISSIRPPTSMSLIKSVAAGFYPLSIHLYKDKIYVGMDNRCDLLRYDLGLSSSQILAKLASNVSSIQAYNDELYVCFALKELVTVYDMTGTFRRSWKHCCKAYNKLKIVSNTVVVSNSKVQALTVYDNQGQLVKQIKCAGISSSDNWKAMAVCEDDSVVVSDHGTGSVFRVNLDSGEVMWTSKHVQYPEGVVCYKNRYVLVTNKNKDTRIWILDADTGMCLFSNQIN